MSSSQFSKSVKIFCSYSHKDERFRDQLETQISPLRRNGLIQLWHDGKVYPGQSWEDAIHENLLSSDLILFLISPNFFSSDYCYEKELHMALKLHRQGKQHIIPIILSPVSWKSSILRNLQVLPLKGKPIIKWRPREDGWQNVVEGIAAAINSLPLEKLKRSIDFLSTTNNPSENLNIAQYMALDSAPNFLAECLEELKECFLKFKNYPMTQHWIAIAIGTADSPEAKNILSELREADIWHPLVQNTLKKS
jgi:hypothetical protein